MNKIYYTGDIVRLNSSSVTMTVISYDPTTDCYRCHWFNSNNDLKEGIFLTDELTLVKTFD